MFGRKRRRLEAPKGARAGYYAPLAFREAVAEDLGAAHVPATFAGGFLAGVRFCCTPRHVALHGVGCAAFAEAHWAASAGSIAGAVDGEALSAVRGALAPFGYEVDLEGDVAYVLREVAQA